MVRKKYERSRRSRRVEKKHGREQSYREYVTRRQAIILGSVLVAIATIAAIIIVPRLRNKKPVEIEVSSTPTSTSVPVSIQDTATPSPTEEVLVVMDEMMPYVEDNSDTVGLIMIEDTVIDYPVVYSGDNEFYMNHSFEKKDSKAGWIFMDYRCDAEEPQSNMILYGHHMKDGSMFAELMKFKDKTFFDNHPIIRFDTLYEELEWEIFAAYVTDTSFYYINTDFHNDEEWLNFIRTCQDKSKHETDIELRSDDVILTLSTCTYEYDDARYVVQARLKR